MRDKERRYWLWVSGPEYYLDENGDDRIDLDPSYPHQKGDWWTCHQDTHEDDLVLIWRTRPKCDIDYLAQAASDAYSLEDNDYAREKGWKFGCDWRTLCKFTNPVTIEDLRTDTACCSWGPLRAQFRRRVYQITEEFWTKIVELIAEKNPELQNWIAMSKTTSPRKPSDSKAASRVDKTTRDTEDFDERSFIEGEKRAVTTSVRNPLLRAAAKKKWGTRCFCCGFDFEQFYGSIAKGFAIVHHLHLFTATDGKNRKATVDDVRVLCANCHDVIHLQNPPIDVEDLKKSIAASWTLWSNRGIERKK